MSAEDSAKGSAIASEFVDLRGALQYVPQFRGRVFVIAVDGSIVASAAFSDILLDISVLLSLDIQIVLVFGAGAQVRELAEGRGKAVSDTEGIGETDEETLQLSIDAITRMTSFLMQELTSLKLKAVTSNALMARAAGVRDGRDLGATGVIESVEAGGLKAFLQQGMIPVIAPLGYDSHRATFRLNSDECAAEVAVALGASKVIYLTGDQIGTTPRQVPVDRVEELLKNSTDSTPGFRSKVRSGAKACKDGVARAHIIDGSVSECILRELFSNEGIATMLYVDTYRKVRAATTADVADILALLHQAVEAESLVWRTSAEILEKIADYSVLEVDGNIVGTVALHVFAEESVAELACLYIRPTHEGQGYGIRLVEYAEKEARARGAAAIFALTTQRAAFFEKRMGYQKVEPKELPTVRAEKLAASGRNSKVLRKTL